MIADQAIAHSGGALEDQYAGACPTAASLQENGGCHMMSTRAFRQIVAIPDGESIDNGIFRGNHHVHRVQLPVLAAGEVTAEDRFVLLPVPLIALHLGARKSPVKSHAGSELDRDRPIARLGGFVDPLRHPHFPASCCSRRVETLLNRSEATVPGLPVPRTLSVSAVNMHDHP